MGLIPNQQDKFSNDYLYKLLRGDIVYLQILISIVKYERVFDNLS